MTHLQRVGAAERLRIHNQRVFRATAHIGTEPVYHGWAPDYEAVLAFRRKCSPGVLRRLSTMVRPYFPTMRWL